MAWSFTLVRTPMSGLERKQVPLSKSRAVIELTVTGMLWGLGFVAAVWALAEAGPIAITGWRFTIAGLTGLLCAKRFVFSKSARAILPISFWPGVFIAATILFQTWGLQYTTATKSSFLTCLYVLIVPMMDPFFGGARPTRSLFLCSIVALFGVSLMCGLFSPESLDAKSRMNFGDFLTLLCAFAASAHIIVIGHVHKKLGPDFNGFDFNTMQSLWAGLPTLLVACFIEPEALRLPLHFLQTSLNGNSLPLLGFLSLTFFSTLIGFALQVRAQRVLSPSTASLLFLLESPFAALFAFVLLGEKMGLLQLAGGLLILVAVAYSSFAAIRAGLPT